MTENDAVERFVESWGSMGVVWGINRSMARIHALLLISSDPVDMDTVSTRLGISRGNASMSLKELRNWGVIHRIHLPGDRKDYYVVETDVWKMFFRIFRERKKREFDPALAALRHLLSEGDTEGDAEVHGRLIAMESLLSTVEKIVGRFLASEDRSRGMLDFFSSTLAE